MHTSFSNSCASVAVSTLLCKAVLSSCKESTNDKDSSCDNSIWNGIPQTENIRYIHADKFLSLHSLVFISLQSEDGNQEITVNSETVTNALINVIDRSKGIEGRPLLS